MRLRKLLAHTVLAYPRVTVAVTLVLTLVSVQVAIRRLTFISTHDALTGLSGRLGQVQAQYHKAFGDPDLL